MKFWYKLSIFVVASIIWLILAIKVLGMQNSGIAFFPLLIFTILGVYLVINLLILINKMFERLLQEDMEESQ